MVSIKQETVKGVFWSGIEKFSDQGLRFTVGLVLARLLTPNDFGLVAMLTIFFSISETFIDSGFGTALIRKQNRTEKDFSTVFYFNIVVSFIFYTILFIFAPWVAVFFHASILCPILRVQAICLIFGGFTAVINAKLIIELNFKALAICSILATSISGCVGIFMAVIGYGVWSLICQTILYSLAKMIFVWLFCRWKPKLIFSWDSFKELGTFGSKLLAAGLINTLYINLTPLAIGRFYTSKDLGFYNRGAEFSKLPNQACLSILEKVTFPIFAKIQDDNYQLINVYKKYVKITSLFLIFFSLLLAALAKPIILLLLTDKWADSIIYLQLFCFAVMFNHINSINLSLLKINGRSDLFLRLEIIKKVVAVLILFAAIPFGVLAICISNIIYDQVAIVINTYYSGKLFNMGYFSQMKDYIGYFFLSLLACLPTYIYSMADSYPLLQIIVGCVLSSVIYFSLLYKDPNFREIVLLIKNIKSK